jgi:hypothetical protein
VAVFTTHLVARRVLLEHHLDHTPAAGRACSLRLDDDSVPDVSDHAKPRMANLLRVNPYGSALTNFSGGRSLRLADDELDAFPSRGHSP